MSSIILYLTKTIISFTLTISTWLTPTTIWTILALILLMRRYSPNIYDLVVVHMTSRWYQEVFEHLPAGARILDIGIGTGTALVANEELVKNKKFSIVGVDYDAAYVEKCASNFHTHNLTNHAVVIHKSVFDKDLLPAANRASKRLNENELFDYVYFSGSFSLMPSPHVALASTFAMLKKPGGQIIITQTFQKQNIPLLKFIKPALKFFTTIDFGQLTFVSQVQSIVDKSGLHLLEMRIIDGSVNNAFQAAYFLRIGNQ
jgi:SAM-dependent methyltransferase